MLLLVLFSFSLAGPAVFADSESQLPACCRRLGQHHCDALQDVERQQSSGSVIRNVSPKCPFFPLAHAVPAYGKTTLGGAAQTIVASTVSQRMGFARTEARSRISFSHAHQKRGPPVLL
jgi:hypothetical protein